MEPNKPSLTFQLMAAIAFADLPRDFTCGQARQLLAKIESIIEPVIADKDARNFAAIASWDEERQRALREAARVNRANKLLDEALSHVRNTPLADAIAAHLAEFNP